MQESYKGEQVGELKKIETNFTQFIEQHKVIEGEAKLKWHVYTNKHTQQPTVYIENITRDPSLPGTGHEMMKKICRFADTQSIDLELKAQQQIDEVPLPKLIKFYTKHGFYLLSEHSRIFFIQMINLGHYNEPRKIQKVDMLRKPNTPIDQEMLDWLENPETGPKFPEEGGGNDLFSDFF